MTDCAWCLKPDAKLKVAQTHSDGCYSELYAFFCDTTHHANWGTNQPRPPGAVMKIDEFMSPDVLAKECNLVGWGVNNCFQFGVMNGGGNWRVNLQKYTPEGSSTSDMCDYADGPTMSAALHAALLNALERDKRSKKPSRLKQASPQREAEVWNLFREVMTKLDDQTLDNHIPF